MCTLGSGPKVKSSVAGGITGVRPQSKVARDCTLAPDPGAAPDPKPAGYTLAPDPKPAGYTQLKK